MTERFFTAAEAEVLALESDEDVLGVDSVGTSRWTEHMETTVRAEDGKIYRINWQSGLTEYQENVFYSDEYPEVFPHSRLNVSETTEYLTHYELKKVESSSVDADIDSLRLVSDAEEVDACFTDEKTDRMRDALRLLEELEALDPAADLSAHRKAAVRYFSTLLGYTERAEESQ